MNLEHELVHYFESLGLEVNLNTKARGHMGFFLANRIDISKHTPLYRVVPTLLHEFAHYIYEKVEKSGSYSPLFDDACPVGRRYGLKEENKSLLQAELLAVTNFVDENSLCKRLYQHKEQVKRRIKSLETIIKEDYPNFMRSKNFKEFDKFIKRSKARYLLKYDKIKLISRFLRRVEIYSLDSIEVDFPDMPKAFAAYIRLKSAQRKQSRISARINKYNKYYSKPTELFARLVEGLYIDEEKTRQLAPCATARFHELLEQGYYLELQHVFKMLSADTIKGNFDDVLTLC